MMQSLFALALSTRVLKHGDPSLIVLVTEDQVRDQLLEAGVFFHFGSSAVAGVLGAEQLAEIFVGVGRKALEVADAVKHIRRDNKNVFRFHKSHGESLPECE